MESPRIVSMGLADSRPGVVGMAAAYTATSNLIRKALIFASLVVQAKEEAPAIVEAAQ